MKRTIVILLVSAIIAYVNAQSCSSINCAGFACCPDEVTGPVCIYQPSLYTCASGIRLCGAGEGVCNTVCYDESMYYCSNGVITQLPSSASATVGSGSASASTSGSSTTGSSSGQLCGTVDCGAGIACCNDVVTGPVCIYQPDLYTCAVGTDGDRLCGKGDGVCNNNCYDASMYYCNNNVITQLPQGSTTGSAPATTSAPITTSAPGNNCPGAANTAGVNCPSGTTCCGAGTITPTCINNTDTSVQCCVYFLSSTQCPAGSTCGGSLGPGASSDAQCGAPGTSFCDAGFNFNAFCTADQVCCTSGGTGICCPSGSSCGINECIAPSGPTSAATTAAPTVAPTGCASIDCGGSACCDDEVLGPVCIYQPNLYTCASGVRLCGAGEGVCNTVCYDESLYTCQNGVITQIPQ